MELRQLNEKKKTEVGSYFVANYPPFSTWSRDHLPATREMLASAAPRPAPPLGLYLHIPFCRKRCKFCYFRVYTDKNSRDVETYLDGLTREIALYRDQPRLAGREFEFVYFGGGTPSFLSEEQLKRLIERINRSWRWDAAREVTFECEPGTLKRSKLEAIKAIGVTRLSLGVEHTEDEILEANGRAHRSAETARAYEWAREVGFQQVNIDLIAGMVGDTDKKWSAAIAKTLEMAPDSLTIYQMELPFNTVFSKEARAVGNDDLVADWATKRRWVEQAFQLFESAGYVVSSGYTLVKPGPHAKFVYRDSLWHGADMVGTGVASFSHVGGVHFQNLDQWDEYLAATQRGELPIQRALPVSDRQRLIRELVLQTKLGHVDASYFRGKFGVEITLEFAAAYADLRENGYAEIHGDDIRLSRNGLLRVDALLPAFFEPEFRGVRYT